MNLYNVIGLVGALTYLTSYAALQLGWLKGTSVSYNVANVVAASFVLVSLTHDFNLASAAIQVLWITIGTIGLALRTRKTRPKQQTQLTQPVHTSAEAVGRQKLNLRADLPPVRGRVSLGLQPDSLPMGY